MVGPQSTRARATTPIACSTASAQCMASPERLRRGKRGLMPEPIRNLINRAVKDRYAFREHVPVTAGSCSRAPSRATQPARRTRSVRVAGAADHDYRLADQSRRLYRDAVITDGSEAPPLVARAVRAVPDRNRMTAPCGQRSFANTGAPLRSPRLAPRAPTPRSGRCRWPRERFAPGRDLIRLRSTLEELYREFETGSLRQSVHAKYSLPACQGGKIPNKYGPSCANLCTAAPRRRPRIRSLRPSFSKPPDFAILVRIS